MSKALVEDGVIRCANCSQLMAVPQPPSAAPWLGTLAILATFIVLVLAILRLT